MPEIQYLAYLHNAEDQLRGEAASLQFFSQGAYRNPLVVRVAGLAYQKEFGGHFHNDNGLAVLRDIPGLVVACPAHPSDAPAMIRTCLAAAEVDGTVCVVLEPIALYHERDLHRDPATAGGAHGTPRPRPGRWLTCRSVGCHLGDRWRRDHRDLRQRAADVVCASRTGWPPRGSRRGWSTCAGYAPLPVDDVVREARATGRLLVVDETRRTGGVARGR